MATSKQEAQWVLRAQCGDREALELLLRGVQPSLRRYLMRLVGASSADDVLQEALILVSRKLKWLDVPEAFHPWVYRVASRAAFRHLKKEKRWSEQVRDEVVLDDLPAGGVSRAAGTFARAAGLRRTFAGEPRSPRAAFSGRDPSSRSRRNPRNTGGNGQIAPRVRFGGPSQET